jgi:hypothetical protein
VCDGKINHWKNEIDGKEVQKELTMEEMEWKVVNSIVMLRLAAMYGEKEKLRGMMRRENELLGHSKIFFQ